MASSSRPPPESALSLYVSPGDVTVLGLRDRRVKLMRLATKFEQSVAGSINGRRLCQYLSAERNDLMGTNDKRSRSTRMCLLDPCSRKQLSYIGGISLP